MEGRRANKVDLLDILKFVMQKIHDAGGPAAVLGPLMGKTVDEICLGTRPVVSMSEELPAFKALQLVYAILTFLAPILPLTRDETDRAAQDQRRGHRRQAWAAHGRLLCY